MRLATIQTPAGPRGAVLLGDYFIDLHATDPALPPTVREFLKLGPEGLYVVAEAVRREKAVEYPASEVKLLPPIPDPPKIVCIGLNYRDHAAESGAAIPKEPVLFS